MSDYQLTETDTHKGYIIVRGNPQDDDFSIIGPFPDYASAQTYAAKHGNDENAMIVAMERPK